MSVGFIGKLSEKEFLGMVHDSLDSENGKYVAQTLIQLRINIIEEEDR